MLPLCPPAKVEVDESRRYISVNDAACRLLGYSREEFLELRIDDISFPSGAHTGPMYDQFEEDGSMQGIFALRRKAGDVIWVRFHAEIVDGRSFAVWTHYEPWQGPNAHPVMEDFR